MFDISGTMWMVALCFVYGLKSIWIPWLWPVFNQVFMMMFLSKWLRRSNANTGAEWLQTRFGLKGQGVTGSHIIVIAFALISCLGFLGVWLCRPGKIYTGVYSLGCGKRICTLRPFRKICTSFLWYCVHAVCHVLFHYRRYA